MGFSSVIRLPLHCCKSTSAIRKREPAELGHPAKALSTNGYVILGQLPHPDFAESRFDVFCEQIKVERSRAGFDDPSCDALFS
jgi:hypothetical protein